eukprot:gene17667-24016_t
MSDAAKSGGCPGCLVTGLQSFNVRRASVVSCLGLLCKLGRHLRSPPLHIEVLTLSHSGGSSGSSGNSDPKTMSSGGMEGNARADIVTHAIYGPLPFRSEGAGPKLVRPRVTSAVAAALRKEIADRMLAEPSFQSNHVTKAWAEKVPVVTDVSDQAGG